jgi:hypothetical protein
MNAETTRPLAVAAEKVVIEVNGARQGIFITRSGRSLPVLLYLHDGMTDYFLERKYPPGLEQFFTVVWWEQRGSGMSYLPRARQQLITVDQLIDDTLALSDQLRRRSDQPGST